MNNLIKPPKNADYEEYLRSLYTQTEQDIIAEIERKRRSGYVDYAEIAALERVQALLQNMVDETWTYAPIMIAKIFYHSEASAKGYKNARLISAGALSIEQSVIIDRLTNNLIGDIIEATASAQASAEMMIARLDNDIYRMSALQSVIEYEASGGAWKGSASNAMIQSLTDNKITGFVDKSGRHWSLSAYSNMATRTTARQAQVAALLTVDPAHDLYQIVPHNTSCPLCAPFEGRIYSRSGNDPNYPALSIAFGKVDPYGSDDLSNTYLNIHPNCLHTLIKYTTVGKTDKQILKGMDFSSIVKNPLNVDPRSKKEIEAYRNKVAARQKLLNDIKQFKRYQSILGEGFPKTFKTFQKHKLQRSEKYQKWKESYRKTRFEAKKNGGQPT